MEALLDDYVNDSDLKMFENNYKEKLNAGQMDSKTKFEYSWALIRSRYPSDIRKGVNILMDLSKTADVEAKRDYFFYTAVGTTKLKEYYKALQYIKMFLETEPNNRQALQLEALIKSRLRKEGLMGAAIVGGAAIVLGGLVGIGMSLAKK